MAGRHNDEVTLLAVAARAGDRHALGALIAATQRDVWRICAVLGRRGEADDLTQETFLRAIRALPSYREEAPARPWLLSIARRVCADDLRRTQRTRRLVERLRLEAIAPSASPPRSAGTMALLESLDPERREAFAITQILGFSYEEASQIVDCPVGTIRSRVARARIELAELLRQAEAI